MSIWPTKCTRKSVDRICRVATNSSFLVTAFSGGQSFSKRTFTSGSKCAYCRTMGAEPRNTYARNDIVLTCVVTISPKRARFLMPGAMPTKICPRCRAASCACRCGSACNVRQCSKISGTNTLIAELTTCLYVWKISTIAMGHSVSTLKLCELFNSVRGAEGAAAAVEDADVVVEADAVAVADNEAVPPAVWSCPSDSVSSASSSPGTATAFPGDCSVPNASATADRIFRYSFCTSSRNGWTCDCSTALNARCRSMITLNASVALSSLSSWTILSITCIKRSV